MEPLTARVVLAHDDPDYRRIVRLTLERDGSFEVVGEADDVDRVLALVTGHRPDVVVLDLDMPGDGRSIVRSLRTAAPDTRIVILTGLDPDLLGGLRDLGVDSVVRKGSPSHAMVRAVAGAAYRP